MNIKQQLYLLFESPTKHKLGVAFQAFIFFNIILSILIVFLETDKDLEEYYGIFETLNTAIMIFFILEYILRIYAINSSKKRSRLKYMMTPFMIIDLLVILPFLLNLLGFDLNFLRSLRIIRIFKLFRLTKFAQFDDMVVEILSEKKEELLFITISIFVLIFTITPLVYYVEVKAQPEVFASMSDTLWWAIITFTTVGYGDMYPITAIGRFLTTIISVLGIAFYAIPGSIFTTALLEKINHRKQEKKELKNKIKK